MDQNSGGLVSIDRDPRRATLRSFGLALALLCCARGAWSWAHDAYQAAIIASALAVVLAGVALVRPSTWRWPYLLLGVLTFPARWMVSYLILAVVYFAVITPIACAVRSARKLRAREEKPHSHWRESPPRGDKPSYFRQF